MIGLLYFVRPVPGIGDKACPIGCRSIEVLLKNTIIIGIKVLRLSQEAIMRTVAIRTDWIMKSLTLLYCRGVHPLRQ